MARARGATLWGLLNGGTHGTPQVLREPRMKYLPRELRGLGCHSSWTEKGGERDFPQALPAAGKGPFTGLLEDWSVDGKGF